MRKLLDYIRKIRRHIYIRGNKNKCRIIRETFKKLGYKNYNDWNYDDDDVIYYTKFKKIKAIFKNLDEKEYDKVIDEYEEYRFDD